MKRRVPVMRQMEVADCGAVCLGMVLAYHGKYVPLDELREMTGTSGRNGVDALAIVRAARTYGLQARGVAADVDALEDLPRGSILHWAFSHFVIFERLGKDGVHVVDPAHGRRRVPMETFRSSYTGVAVVFEPAEEFTPSGSKARGTWRYLRPILDQSRTLARVLVISVLLRILALATPLLVGLLVDDIAPRDDRHLLFVFAAMGVVLIAYFFVASLLRAHLLLQLRTRLDLVLTKRFVHHLVDLPYGFFLQRSAGDLMMRLQSNSLVREILTTGALTATLDGALASLYLVLLVLVSGPLALLVLVLAVLQVTTMLLTWRRNERLMAESLQVEARSQSYAYELLGGIETLKASGAEHGAAEHWGDLYVDQVRVALTRGRVGATVEAVLGTLRMASPLVVLLYGGAQVINGSMTLGTMLAASALAAGFLEPLAALVGTALQAQVLTSYMERINDVLDKEREQEGRDLPPAPELSGRVEAQGVSFSYGRFSPRVVDDVSLEIRPGQHVGIVGRSGSGKSTLAHLLLGLYAPTTGRILFDGTDLDEFEVRSVRRQVGIVTQRPYLFGSTIRENIALNQPGLPLDAIIEAARMACIHDDIAAMPMGYETTLMDGGSSLSGGQHQRIALARALVHRPAILVLDEATSELDTITERQVYENLDELGSTVIVIAHRLSTITNADVILVMEDGRIVERGSHRELIETRGAYWELVAAQSKTSGATESTSGAMMSASGAAASTSTANGTGQRERVATADADMPATHTSCRDDDDPWDWAVWAALLDGRHTGGDDRETEPGDRPAGDRPPDDRATADRAGEQSAAGATVAGCTRAELYRMASKLGVRGRSSMNKEQLVDAIIGHHESRRSGSHADELGG
jgi:ATP-binding cassette subfamily B protein